MLCFPQDPCYPHLSKKTKAIIPFVGLVPVILLPVVIYFICKAKSEHAGSSKGVDVRVSDESDSNPAQYDDVNLETCSRSFSRKELETITNSYKQVIGIGGSGTVYFGCLDTGALVAVKVLSVFSPQGTKEFVSEVEHLSRVHHENLVTLGKSQTGEFKPGRIIFEFYLKSQKVKLNYDPHVLNFQTHVCANKYVYTYELNQKSDVYSFEVVLLEVVSGLLPIITSGEENIHITQWIKDILSTKNIEDVIDPKLVEHFDSNSVWKVMDLAFICTAQNSDERPTIAYVPIYLSCRHDKIASCNPKKFRGPKESINLSVRRPNLFFSSPLLLFFSFSISISSLCFAHFNLTEKFVSKEKRIFFDSEMLLTLILPQLTTDTIH
ncbi:hypothetical protein LUZ60_000854 [Juncus effusus]|nr:hypothetical protein LUZ60_000854 [Juncus effusus]